MTQNLLLVSSGWGTVVLIIAGLFGGAILLANMYSSIVEKTKTKDKDGCGWPIFLIIVAIIIGILIGLKDCSCKSHHKNDYNQSDEYWENTPRHT